MSAGSRAKGEVVSAGSRAEGEVVSAASWAEGEVVSAASRAEGEVVSVPVCWSGKILCLNCWFHGLSFNRCSLSGVCLCLKLGLLSVVCLSVYRCI